MVLFGARNREEQARNLQAPGTYWYVQDYLERGTHDGMHAGLGASTDEAIAATREEYVEKYGRGQRRRT